MKQKVVISGSGNLQNKVAYWKDHFETKGYEIIAFPKPLESSNGHDQKLKGLYVNFYDAIDECDVFFLMNEDKNDTAGYIGANGTAELIYATVKKLRGLKDIKIYIAKVPDPEVPIFKEVESFLRLGWAELYIP